MAAGAVWDAWREKPAGRRDVRREGGIWPKGQNTGSGKRASRGKVKDYYNTPKTAIDLSVMCCERDIIYHTNPAISSIGSATQQQSNALVDALLGKSLPCLQ